MYKYEITVVDTQGREKTEETWADAYDIDEDGYLTFGNSGDDSRAHTVYVPKRWLMLVNTYETED